MFGAKVVGEQVGKHLFIVMIINMIIMLLSVSGHGATQTYRQRYREELYYGGMGLCCNFQLIFSARELNSWTGP